MKKLLTLLTALLVIIIIAMPVAAKKIKIPKQVCWSYDNGGPTKYLAITIRKGGYIKSADGKVQFYDVQGAHFDGNDWAAMTGSTYMVSPDMKMHLASHYTGFFYSFEVDWDLESKAGDLYRYGGNPPVEKSFSLTEIKCKTLNVTCTSCGEE